MNFERALTNPFESKRTPGSDENASTRKILGYVDQIKTTKEDERPAKLQTFAERLKRDRFGKMLLVAAGLHVPYIYGDKIIAYAKAAMSHVEGWDGRILHPQSKEEQAKVEALEKEREAHADPEGVARFKEESRKRIEAGNPPSFAEVYFKMEELKGVPHDQVEAARKKADALIDSYSSKFLTGFDETELKQFVQTMYGPESNYEWGQGSATVYFNTGRRNCNAVEAGQTIVLEGVMRHMPEETQKKYQLGKQFVQQHTYATLSEMRRDGKASKTYLLEPSLKIVNGGIGEAGTATVSIDILKQAIVSDSPVTIDAKSGTLIPKGPILDVKTDQPVSDNLIINGPLKPSEFVMKEIGEPVTAPETTKIQQETSNEPDVVELTLEEPALTVEEARKLRASKEKFGTNAVVSIDEKELSPEVIKELNAWEGKELPYKYSYQDVSKISKEAAVELFGTSARVLSITTDKDGQLPDAFYDALYSEEAKNKHFNGILKMNTFSKNREMTAGFFSRAQEARMRSTNKQPAVGEIYLEDVEIDRLLAARILKGRFERLYVHSIRLDEVTISFLESKKTKIAFTNFFDVAMTVPEIVGQRNFEPIEIVLGHISDDPKQSLLVYDALAARWKDDVERTDIKPEYINRIKAALPKLNERIEETKKLIRARETVQKASKK